MEFANIYLSEEVEQYLYLRTGKLQRRFNRPRRLHILSINMAIVSKLCFQYLANSSELIIFYFP